MVALALPMAAAYHRAPAGPAYLVKAFLHALFRRFGLDVVRYTPSRFPELRRLRVLEERAIGLVVDVGANNGDYARTIRRNGFGGRIVSFEPSSEAFCALQHAARADAAWEAHHLALGDRSGWADLHVAGNSLSSSLLLMRERHVRGAPESAVIGTERVRIARLDDIAETILGAAGRAFLKLDVQGYELQVLRGAVDTLSRVEAVEVELSLQSLYEGDSVFGDVLTALGDHGFSLVSLEDGFRDTDTRELLQVDGLFERLPIRRSHG